MDADFHQLIHLLHHYFNKFVYFSYINNGTSYGYFDDDVILCPTTKYVWLHNVWIKWMSSFYP